MSYKNSRRPHRGRNFRNNNSRRGGNQKKYIDPIKFVKSAESVEVEDYQPTNSFSDFNIHPTLAHSLSLKGFDQPTPIQDQAIPHALNNRDVIGLANTGTGKTLAFALPVINKLANNRSKALIIAPTRELAQQILDEFKPLTKGHKIYWSLLIGGSSMRNQLRDLSRSPNLIIGTPGRIKDHLERRSLKLDDFDTVVLDEADRMLDMGFVDDMREILYSTPKNRQTLLFSATIDARVKALVNQFTTNPETISVKTGDTSQHVEQNVVKYQMYDDKLQKLHDLLESDEIEKVLIFDDTRRDVEGLAQTLSKRGFRTDSIHGGKSQGQRQRALKKFKDSHTNILVATDVAARGIDITDITHVINYSTPQTYDDYVHRIGRAGRAGRVGFALTFVQGR